MGNHHSRWLCVNECVSTRGGFAVMAAGLKRHINGCTLSREAFLCEISERHDFGMGLSGSLRHTFGDNLAVFDNHTTDSRVGCGHIQPRLGKL